MDKKYLPRIIDNKLKDYLEAIGAVLIIGPKWCGKTTTGSQKANSILKMQDTDNKDKYMETASTMPSLLLEGAYPRLIDEWQVAPVLWDAVKTKVDDIDKPGLFILTGSTTVDNSKIMHSGTGRIGRLMMRTMSLFESLESNGKISLRELFDNKDLDINGIESTLTIPQLIFAACRGGWPSSLNKSEKQSLLTAKLYLENIIYEDISTVDGIKKNPNKVRALLKSYARNISTLASNKTILRDINDNNTELSESGMYTYIDALDRLFILDDIQAWTPNVRSATAIRATTKKEFIDPSVAVAALGLTPDILKMDFKTFGFIFENLCIRDLKIYSDALDGNIRYYNDRYGLEIDIVLSISDGRYALIEVKLGSSDFDKAARNLLKLSELLKEEGKKMPDLLIILTGGSMAYTRKDGIKIIPIGCLKD